MNGFSCHICFGSTIYNLLHGVRSQSVVDVSTIKDRTKITGRRGLGDVFSLRSLSHSMLSRKQNARGLI